MRILVHDYAGHPFQAELSRELARRGHMVCHAYFAGDQGPKGRMTLTMGDPDSLQFFPVTLDTEFSKTNFIKRRYDDLAYGRRVAELIHERRPQIVISGNTPTESQEQIIRACTRAGDKFIFWCQDLFSIAASRILKKKLPVVGPLIGAYYQFLERRQMRLANHIIHITESFCAQTDAWGITRSKITVIPNWGALDEIDMLERPTGWARDQGLDARPVLLYSGTLALKHNPALLLALAREVEDADTVVVSAGVGADDLAKAKSEQNLPRLRLLPLQPFEIFAEVLGTADVLLAVIEREAGAFSVPSKILSYLCAGRPIVLAAPADNLAAEIIRMTGAGRAVEPEDAAGFVAATRVFLSDPEAARVAGEAGRRYAEENFDLARMADRFEAVFRKVLEKEG